MVLCDGGGSWTKLGDSTRKGGVDDAVAGDVAQAKACEEKINKSQTEPAGPWSEATPEAVERESGRNLDWSQQLQLGFATAC